MCVYVRSFVCFLVCVCWGGGGVWGGLTGPVTDDRDVGTCSGHGAVYGCRDVHVCAYAPLSTTMRTVVFPFVRLPLHVCVSVRTYIGSCFFLCVCQCVCVCVCVCV